MDQPRLYTVRCDTPAIRRRVEPREYTGRRARWKRLTDSTPVTPTAAIKHDPSGTLFSRKIDVDSLARRYFEPFVWIGPATSALLPVTVMPAGRSPDGLPISVQIVGPYL